MLFQKSSWKERNYGTKEVQDILEQDDLAVPKHETSIYPDPIQYHCQNLCSDTVSAYSG